MKEMEVQMQRNAPAGRSSAKPVPRSLGIVLACTLAALAIAGCRSKPPAEASATLTGNVQTYQVKGIVVSSDPAAGEVTVDSEAIPGFMAAMTMPYKLAQPNIASELHPGDHITGRLRVSDTASQLDQIVVTSQARPDYKPSVTYNVPQPGQQAPDFKFVNQSGKTIHLDQFRGKVLLVTFIYTRCPLPEYCIRMTRNFAQINQELAADPALYAKTHLLSISFDPGYDTPKVLRSYGETYTGNHTPAAFAHWDFAVPPAAELQKVDEFFDVGVTPGKDGTITHSLSTAVIGPDGKIVSWYPTNEWQPSALIQDAKRAITG
jgi:protein SCO1/2